MNRLHTIARTAAWLLRATVTFVRIGVAIAASKPDDVKGGSQPL